MNAGAFTANMIHSGRKGKVMTEKNRDAVPVELTTVTMLTPLSPSGEPLAEERETVRTAAVGCYTEDTGEQLICFTAEGNENEIRVTKDGATVKSRGGVVSEMHFAFGKTHESIYRVPPFSFPLAVTLLHMDSTLSCRGGSLRLSYRMSLGGDERAVAFSLSIRPTEEGDE